MLMSCQYLTFFLNCFSGVLIVLIVMAKHIDFTIKYLDVFYQLTFHNQVFRCFLSVSLRTFFILNEIIIVLYRI